MQVNDSDKVFFDVHASVVFQLGEDLITDVVQALIELVKNSYDADATRVRLTVAADSPPGDDSSFPNAKGYISIEDNGVGMDRSTIERGWLTISNSLKRESKRKGIVTARGRTPLGDKGLGRLGIQSLGDNVEISTRPEGSDVEHYVALSWPDFATESNLSDVPLIYRETSPTRRKPGTKIVVSNLKQVDAWTGDGLQRLERGLSQMLSPYSAVKDFRVVGSLNGRNLELNEISKRLRDTAQVRYRIDFDGSKLTIAGRAKLTFLRPDPKDTQESAAFSDLIEADNGKRFLEHLRSQRKGNRFHLEHSTEGGWFVRFGMSRSFDDLDNPGSIAGRPANPGPFHAEIDGFDLAPQGSSEQSIFDRFSEYRKTITTLSGIRVYRDGFGIRVDQDWLRLGQQWTSGGSWYGLKPNNTLGYVAISSKANAQLEETTDREGFKRSPYYDNFYEMLQQSVRFAHDVQEFLRRGSTRFLKDYVPPAEEQAAVLSTEQLGAALDRTIGKAATLAAPVAAAGSVLSRVGDAANADLASARSALPADSAIVQRLDVLADTLSISIEETKALLGRMTDYLSEIGEMKEMGTIFRDRIETLRDQLQRVYETVSLGLTAEALSHEIHNVADQLARRTREASRRLGQQPIRDAKLISYVEYVDSAVAMLRKELSHLAPSLRYVREKKEDIEVGEFLLDLSKYHNQRIRTPQISLCVRTPRDFRVRMNRGKLVQVFDNLILNAEYWLRRDVEEGRVANPEIAVAVQSPMVTVSDNGRGVDPAYEEDLFEPFVSAKETGKGRGLGLYIVRQLLDADNCAISLLPERNERGRRYVFQIDFTGAIIGPDTHG